MELKKQTGINRILSLLMIMLLCSFTIFSTYSWGRYVMLACIALIFMIDLTKRGLKYKCIFGLYFIILSLFVLYAFISSLWAESSSDAISQGKTLFEILCMIFVLYNYYDSNENGVRNILSLIKWSSYIVIIYSIFFYGIDNLMLMAETEGRIDNVYANVNTIGMLAAVGILIQIDEIIQEKKLKLASVFCIPSVFVLALTQSRKAFVVLILGCIIILLLRNVDSKDALKTIFRIMISIIVMVILLNLILSLPIFSGMMSRMDGLLANFTGTGKVDSSTRMRNLMVDIGWEQFRKTPILGMGIGNPHILSVKYVGMDAYLHNNFIELLAGGGIVGFSIYYSMYLYLIISFMRYWKYKNNEYIICFTIMLLLLIMDYGRVSYYSKINYIYLMLYFLEVQKLKVNARQSAQGRYKNNEYKENYKLRC